ncbi:hypothetical protein QA584_22620 [Anaerocolumna sp. AGMB13025]|uniref:hypothetical protein n=1 Tax=Anaerocolumna sp. AGMB13025 TaxID=3039116 RepID=UPI00241E4818|nr:hypothetical protein [Anaerocolumna sp. AGMB13025]WFR56380.1 hypothetical protein QA584_22620 [Anaerocolumna sp. AGMB13025]
MQSVSQVYKQSMKQILRNRSYMKVTIGVINQEAQRTAKVPAPDRYTYFSNLLKPFDNYTVDYLYATAEQNYSAVDGSMLFLPRSPDNVVFNSGIVTADLLGSIEISFSTTYDIKGLTIEFGKTYPVEFMIESDYNTVHVTGNSSGHFVTEEIFPQATFIRITPQSMVNGQGRFRIHQITMGLGIYFDNKKIISSSLKDSVSPISEDMPAIDFNFTIDNQDKVFDIDNEKSSINFLETGQECIVEYGYDIEDNFTEWVPGAKLYLKNWSANDKQMKCTAVDRFEYMQGSYYKGNYYPEGISLYDLAIDVLTDAAVDPREYWLDGYLKTVIVNNPLPVATHKEALQIIANAGRCILSQDRAANIYLKSSFIPDMTATANDEAYYSKVGNILTADTKAAYADAQNKVTTVQGNQFFLPRTESGTNYLNTGYVSEVVADASGLFSINPVITIRLEAAFKCFSFTVVFGGNAPREFIIHTYLENTAVEVVTVTDIEKETVISREFAEFDRMDLEFTLAPAHNRIMVDYVEFGEVTDYILERSLDLSKIPNGNKLEKVKELQVIRTMYNQSGELKELVKELIQVSDIENEFIVNFSNASYGYSCTLEGAGAGQNAEIVESGAYYAKVIINGFIEETEINLIITGYEYAITSARVTQPLNSTGTIETWGNPLVSSLAHARDIGEWIGAYMKADREYDINYRGDPRIDANDILFLDNDYNNDMQIRVSEHTLSFNGTLSGAIKARRFINVDNT